MLKETVPKQISRREFLRQSVLVGAGLPLMKVDFGREQTFEDYLWQVAREIPPIGGKENYDKPLSAGIGYATWHNATIEVCARRGNWLRKEMEQDDKTYDQLTENKKNLFRVTYAGEESVRNALVDNQSDQTPEVALGSGDYSAYIATRSSIDIGGKFLVFCVTSPRDRPRSIRFFGAGLGVDCPRREDWDGNLSKQIYKQQGWDISPLPWIADVSEELMMKLPVGFLQDSKDMTGGRPGLLLVSENTYYMYR